MIDSVFRDEAERWDRICTTHEKIGRMITRLGGAHNLNAASFPVVTERVAHQLEGIEELLTEALDQVSEFEAVESQRYVKRRDEK